MSVDANLERFAITVSGFSKASASELGEAPHVYRPRSKPSLSRAAHLKAVAHPAVIPAMPALDSPGSKPGKRKTKCVPRFSFLVEMDDCKTIGTLTLQVLLWHVVELVRRRRQRLTELIVPLQRLQFLKFLHGESHSELRLVDHLGFLLCGWQPGSSDLLNQT